MHFVYFLWNLDETVLLYIGLSINPTTRWKDFMAREGLCAVMEVVSAHETFEQGSAEELCLIAQHWPPFNKRLASPRGGLGQTVSENTKAKIRAIHFGTRRSSSTTDKISEALTGRKHTEAHRLANAAARKGKPSGRKGKPPTAKQLAAWERQKGKPSGMLGKTSTRKGKKLTRKDK